MRKKDKYEYALKVQGMNTKLGLDNALRHCLLAIDYNRFDSQNVLGQKVVNWSSIVQTSNTNKTLGFIFVLNRCIFEGMT